MWAQEDYCEGISLVGAEIGKLGLETSAVAARTDGLHPFPQLGGERSIKGHHTAAFWSTSLNSGERGKGEDGNFVAWCFVPLRVGQKIISWWSWGELSPSENQVSLQPLKVGAPGWSPWSLQLLLSHWMWTSKGKMKGGIQQEELIRQESHQLLISTPWKGLMPRCSIVLMMVVSPQARWALSGASLNNECSEAVLSNYSKTGMLKRN